MRLRLCERTVFVLVKQTLARNWQLLDDEDAPEQQEQAHEDHYADDDLALIRR
jgi:hypothetical protein